MKLSLIVGLGSFIGGISRYLLSAFVQGKVSSNFPYGTLTVNLTGCFLIGCLFGMAERLQLNPEWRLLLITGVLGGFTTFSAFSLETHHLFKAGHLGMAFLYIISSIFLGISLTFLGAWLFKLTT